MSITKRNIICLFFLLKLSAAAAQDITGTWEGDLGTDQFLQLNVIQVKNKICGYTWDYVKADHKSFCKAYFTGSYDKKHKEWLLEGESFIANSGSHILMRIRLSAAIADGKTVLVGTANAESSPATVIENVLENIFGGQRSIQIRDEISLQKTAARPQQVIDKMKDCYEQEQKLKDTVAKPPVIIKVTDSIVKNDLPVVIKPVDTIAKVITPLPTVVKRPDSVQIPQQMVKRKNTEEGRVVVNTKTNTLNVYDNAIVDGDTVSIFFNGKLLVSHQRLSEKPIVVTIELDENSPRNEIILFAENLGSIPPNTALIVITAGDKRYELFSKASLDENAVLVFEYKPK